MALVVETGLCVPTANAFVTRAELIAYAADYRPDLTVAAATTTDAAILRASAWLSSYPNWNGRMKCGRGLQGLSWPRKDVTDCNGDAVPENIVPIEVKMATYVVALAEIVTPGILAPTIFPGQQRKREKVDVIEVEYMTPKEQGVVGSVDALRPIFSAVGDLLSCFADFPNGVNVPWPWVA